jgi:DNA repair protein RadD
MDYRADFHTTVSRTSMITLRPKQVSLLQEIRNAYGTGYKAPLVVAPCGFGKTVLFSAMAESAAKRGKRVLIICHRIELVDQIVATLSEFDVQPEIIASGYNRSGGRIRAGNRPVAVASVQTLVRRLDSYASPTLIVIDECHHVVSKTWSSIIFKYRDAKILGVTASAMRSDGCGLGAMFDKLIVGPSVRELTDDGLLAPARVFAPPTVDTSGLHIRAGDYKVEESEALMDAPSITGSALSHYRQHADGLPALVFCTSVAHAHHVADQFRKDGIAAFALDGGTDKQVRRTAVKDFRDGAIKVITQCEIATEGWDLPGVHCGIYLRPTQSLALWIQMMGRCSRLSPGKTHAILLDHVGNCQRLGLPTDERKWELTSDTTTRKKPSAATIRVCVKCFAASPARSLVCNECGALFEVKPRQQIEEKDGELVELTAEEIARKKERQTQGMSTLAQLREIEHIKKYRKGWAEHVWKGRMRKKA